MVRMQFYKNFSINQERFLRANGFKYMSKGIHKETGRSYWVYELTPELSKMLENWSITKNDALKGMSNSEK